MIRSRILLAALVSLHILPTLAPAQDKKGRSYALLVGVQDYQHPDLPNLRYAQRDVIELSKLLTANGYDVSLLCHESGDKSPAHKPSRTNIEKHLQDMLRKCERADSVLLAFSGHGLQFDKDDDAFFCPLDARPFPDQKTSLISLKEVYKELERSFAGVKLLMVDACRNDPMLRRGRSGIDADSAPRPPRGVAAMFSCSAGELAFEHEKLEHGVFFYHVLEGLRGKAKNARGTVTFTSLADYVNTHVAEDVPKLLGGMAKQSPNLKADLSGASPVLLTPSESAVVPPVKKVVMPVVDPKDIEHLRVSVLRGLFNKSERSPEFKAFLDKMKERPSIDNFGGGPCYQWKDQGLKVSFRDDTGQLYCITFWHAKNTLGFKQYPGELPNGLKITDRREDIERRFGQPERPLEDDDSYQIADYYEARRLTIIYRFGRIDEIRFFR